ncbi:MAG: hypothetical protein RLZZ292_3581 [Bacteroidota bacterium]|jgi:O-antigen ligase
MILLFALSLVEISTKPFQLKFCSETITSFYKNKIWLILSIPFFIVLISGLWSDDLSYWLERLRIRMPFLFLPLAFAGLPTFSKRQYLGLFYLLFILMIVSTLGVLINYALHFDEMNLKMGMGQAIKTPIGHIRFSLLMAISSISGILLYQEKFTWRYTWERSFLLLGSLFLFIAMHILSVRTGLGVLYATILILGFRHVLYSKRYVLGLVVGLFLAMLPYLAYQYIPSFKQKFNYSRYDLGQYQTGNGENYSDAERIISIEAGLAIGKQHPFIGVGTGDVKMALDTFYQQHYPTQLVKVPHNQFVMIYAETGLLGVGLFCLSLFFPLFYKKKYRDPFFLTIHTILILSFLVESTIEIAVGTAIYAFL